jgi:hypothetical protein
MRLVVLEGLAGYGKAMEELFVDLPRFDTNSKDVTILSNPEVLFHKRLYTDFGPDLKRIRPREKIKKLVQRPELYDRKQVDTTCFGAFESIMGLIRAEDLYTTKEFSLYPSVESLNKFEILYGEAISKEDFDGVRVVSMKKQNKKKSKNSEAAQSVSQKSFVSHTNSSAVPSTAPSSANLKETSTEMMEHINNNTELKHAMATDCWNPYFEEHLAMRDPNHPRHDFVKEHRVIF